jgi:hypothetical protein
MSKVKKITSNYAINLCKESPEEYKLLIQAKVASHLGLAEMLRQAWLYKQFNKQDTGIDKVMENIQYEIKISRSDGFCLHPEQYRHNVGTRFTRCSCCGYFF